DLTGKELQRHDRGEGPAQPPEESDDLPHVPATGHATSALRQAFAVLFEQIAFDVLGPIRPYEPLNEHLRPFRWIVRHSVDYALLFSAQVRPSQMLQVAVFESLSARPPAPVTL